MKKNRIIAGALGGMLMGALALPVYAKDMSVTYRQPNTYIVEIPQAIDLSSGAASNEIAARDVNLEPGTEIRIRITEGVDADGVIELSREQDTETKAVTTISKEKDGAGIAVNEEFVAFTADGTQQLFYSAIAARDGGNVKAGNYSGTITFTVSAPARK